MSKDLILIDGSSFIFRAFYALPNLTSPNKKPTGATYGIANMLKQMLKKYATHNWCCVFDAPGDTFRHGIYSDYKANRRETPSELIPQFADIYALIAALGIPVVIESGVEADDVIGTLALLAKSQGYNVLIATGDKDFAQIVQEQVTLVNTMTNEILDYNGVIDKFGVKPEQIIDYLSLVGDKVDNVPGVEKCGPKTAVKWLNQYLSLEEVIANANDITGVVGENLRQSISWLSTAKDLITIRTDLNVSHLIPNGISQLTLKPQDTIKLSEMYADLGFKTWLRQLETISNSASHTGASHAIPAQDAIPAHNVIPDKLKLQLVRESGIHHNLTDNRVPVLVTSKGILSEIVDKIVNTDNSDILTIVVNNCTDKEALSYLIFATQSHIYLAFESIFTQSSDLFSQGDQLNELNSEFSLLLPSLVNSSCAKVCLNYKETLTILALKGLSLSNAADDITLLHYVSNSKMSHTLDYIYHEVLGMEMPDSPDWFSQLLPQLNSNLSMADLNLIKQQLYRVKYANLVVAAIKNRLSDSELNLYQTIELPLVKVLVAIERCGIKLDVGQLRQLEVEITLRIKQLQEIIYSLANCVFNINSAKQLQDVLFNQLKLPTAGIKKNTNGFSTDEDSLKILAAQGVDVALYLIEYRGLTKLLNTYISKLPPLVDEESRLHTTFEQALVASGRLSSKEPNLQNIPIKSDWGKKIRRAFVAKDGYQLICADYSQIELRILAHFSRDENLVNAFNTNQDIHTITASEIFHKPLHEVTKDERRYAKTINFSLLYGKTVYGLAQELEIDRATAKLYIDTYFAKYPKVLACLEDVKNFARSNGYVETVAGRRIYLPNINASNKIQREAEERLALNAPMQGTSADIIKVAMVRIHDWLARNNLASKIILQVHDELILEVPNHEVELVKANLAGLMSDGFTKLSVKLAVEIKTATNWDEAH
jgi:DNA polymerase-1